MNEDLEAFLAPKPGEAEATSAPDAQPAETAAPEAPAPEAPPEADAEQEPEAADDAGIRKALAAERDKRRDWKEKAIRAEGEMAELRRQLEAARQPPQQPQEQYQGPPPIDPSLDPQGFVSRVQEVMLNERLNTSEMMLRREMGPEAVDDAITAFKMKVANDKTLTAKLYQQPDPYGWMYKQVEQDVAAIKLQREIGTDPNAYRAKIEAELRAKWEAERGEQPLTVPTRSPAAGLPPSLASARNAAPRSNPAFNGPRSLNAVFPD